MSQGGATRWAWSACGLASALAACSVGLAILNDLDAQALFAHHLPGLALDAVAFSILGAMIASRRPEHRIGWLLCAAGVGAGLEALASQYGRYGFITLAGALPAAEIAAWFAAWGYLPTFAIPIELLLMLFPTGRLPSPRWWPIAWLTVGLLLAASALYAISPVLIGGLAIANPFAVPALRQSQQILQTISFVLALSGVLLALSSVVARFRRSRGMERQQLKWFVYAAVLTFLGVEVGPTLLLQNVLTSDTMPYIDGVLGAIAFPCLAGSVAIAILRYRLYDIDLIIRRTLVYGVLSALLALAYWASVVVLQQVLQPLTQGSELAIVGSTLAVAALFQPLRQRIQLTVDRRFYRQHYDAARTLEAFSARLRDEIDLDSLRNELLDVIGRTMQPTNFSLWLKTQIRDEGRNDSGTLGH